VTARPKLNQIIYWVRSIAVGGKKDRVPMYYKGRCNRADEGEVGYDIKARPVRLGQGEYVATYGVADFEFEDGTEVGS
jgi:hypothetical protein